MIMDIFGLILAVYSACLCAKNIDLAAKRNTWVAFAAGLFYFVITVILVSSIDFLK